MIPFFFAVFGLCVVFFFFPLVFFPPFPHHPSEKAPEVEMEISG